MPLLKKKKKKLLQLLAANASNVQLDQAIQERDQNNERYNEKLHCSDRFT